MNPTSNRRRNKRKVRVLRQNSQFPSGDFITKRMTLSTVNLSSTAGGIIAVGTISSNTVQTAPASEWASFAARYQQYRVKSMKIILDPCFPVNTGLTNVTGHTQLYLADFIGTSTPGSAAAVASDERMQVFSSAKPIRFQVTWSRNPNAKLWNPTTAAIPAANTFSICYASSTTATLALSQVYLLGFVEYEVELRGSQ